MNIQLKEIEESLFDETVKMITDFFNYHRKLTNAPKEFWTNDEESLETLKEWMEAGKVFNILNEGKNIGFISVRFGGQDAAWLEDIFIVEQYRGHGIGKYVIKELDKMMKEKGIISIFVSVIPRNTSALQFYIDCGFDHLNMIELRKNYDEKLNKNDNINVLGFDLKKY
ncbi:GNAT family N-acetyltransferase [Haloimpatiens massiliensis]|uniref:GNAT family N-acetyltransferase n=1 Tax=Haloimpatiens massiliensis TaxID=1658110 RepID=UPI000C817D5A|nr:GNAT family N-acetyltransferase [Haloimpatiens massiliensis]